MTLDFVDIGEEGEDKKKSILLGAIYLIVAFSYHGFFFPLSPNMLVMSIPFKLISYR